MPKLQELLRLALITGARIGALLALRWEDCQDDYLTFGDAKNGRVRRIPMTGTIAALLASRARIHPWVFTNTKTERPYTTIRKLFERALRRTNHDRRRNGPHAAPHCAVTMIEHGLDDHTVMSISGHSSTRMLERYTHPAGHKLATRTSRRGRTKKKAVRRRLFPGQFWWTAGGSNSRPPRCERGALPTELAAHLIGMTNAQCNMQGYSRASARFDDPRSHAHTRNR